TGVYGITINASGFTPSGLSVSLTTTTDLNGEYRFTGIGPGSWTVEEAVTSGWFATGLTSRTVTVTSGANVVEVDFSNEQVFQISGKKINDLDGNGVVGAGEPGLAGWTIYWDTNGDGQFSSGEPSVVTGSGGAYVLAIREHLFG